jgi:hypothetical protein
VREMASEADGRSLVKSADRSETGPTLRWERPSTLLQQFVQRPTCFLESGDRVSNIDQRGFMIELDQGPMTALGHEWTAPRQDHGGRNLLHPPARLSRLCVSLRHAVAAGMEE